MAQPLSTIAGRNSRTRLRVTRAALMTLCALVFSGCAPTGGAPAPESAPTLGGHEHMQWETDALDALIAVDARIHAVGRIEWRPDGLGSALVIHLSLSGEQPVSAEMLAGILEAAWRHSEVAPNSVEITASVAESKRFTPVDVYEGAKQLTDRVTRVGAQGAALTLLHVLLGKHPTEEVE